ncbi:MAG TPA: hypothetical protein ENK06_10180 [Gammaproteobacteria bacterium]|nr:hypothetical protein [Gammaproteobacteria bacterium]
MKSFEISFSEWVLKLRWPIVIISLTLVMLAGSGGQYLKFTTDYRIFFSKDNPQLLAFDALEKTYAKNDTVLYVLTAKNGDLFTNKNLEAIEWLTEQAWQTPYSSRVDSISNFQYSWAEEDDLIVEDLVSDAASLNASEISKIKTVALNEPLLVNRLISPTANVTGVSVTIQLPGIDETRETPKVVKFSRQLKQRFLEKYPDVQVNLSGMILMNNAFSEASQSDMQSLVPLSFAIMLISLGILIKGFTGTFATLLVILFSIITAMGLGGSFGLPISPPSASSPIIILTIAIASSVHILVAMLQRMRKGDDKKTAIKESLRVNLQPVTLASLTTVIGFLSMNFSEVPPFQHLGNFVAMGVIASWILSLTFLPALMSFLPVRVKPMDEKKDDVMEKLGEFIVAKRKPLLWGFLAFIAILVSFLPRNELNDIFIHYFDTSVEFRQDADYTTEHLTGLYNISYSLDAGIPGGINNPKYLADVEAFAQWQRKQPETLHVATVTDIYKRLNKNMHGDDPAYYKLPDERELAAQYLLLYEMSLPYGLDLNDQINIDKSASKFTVTIKTLSSKAMKAFADRSEKWLEENTSAIKYHNATGPSLMFANIGLRNTKSMLIGTSLALILISGILIFALRSVKVGLISILPNLAPAAMGFGLWGIMVGEVGLALSVVTGMTLGIVVDDTVHLLSKYLRARREIGYNASEAIVYAFTSVGRALLITSIVLILGFLVLALSAFELNSGMGLLTAIVIFMALTADFFFLPPLLIKLEEKQ